MSQTYSSRSEDVPLSPVALNKDLGVDAGLDLVDHSPRVAVDVTNDTYFHIRPCKSINYTSLTKVTSRGQK